jgi:hypothetical protein
VRSHTILDNTWRVQTYISPRSRNILSCRRHLVVQCVDSVTLPLVLSLVAAALRTAVRVPCAVRVLYHARGLDAALREPGG